ncbi:MAG: hypothetical protein FJZ01_20900 [Candidatus Sericytochromatia bacterium]|nr:hypothetical protein [Candidatus Tanganyikabacteria bacterium]
MQILSHRGCWKAPAEKNTAQAFARSFALGFGTETDLRDQDGRLVISHDPATEEALPAEVFFKVYRELGYGLPLALNIKADGLQPLLENLLAGFKIDNYFVFDMSVPDTLPYLRREFAVFSRQSEYEPEPALYDKVTGIWVDCFEDDWVSEDDVARHLQAGKRVCLVSPDLHRRPHEAFWAKLREWGPRADLMLCTDYPEQAKEYFDAH